MESWLYYGSVFGRSQYLSKQNVREKEIASEYAAETDLAYLQKIMRQKRQETLEKNVRQILENCREKECSQAELIHVLRSVMRKCCAGEPEFETDFLIDLQLAGSADYETLGRKVCETLCEYIKLQDGSEEAGTEYTIYRVQDYLDEHYREKLVIQEIADHFGLNYSYMCSLFRKYKGMSPNEYLIMKKMEQAKKLLKTKENISIRDIAELVGYTDQYYFSRMFKAYEKVSPKEYRKREHIEK